LNYRKLKEQDAAVYWALRLEAVEREPRSFGPTPEEHRQITIDEIATLVCGRNSFVMGAFDDEAIIGFARFEREPNLKERHKGHVRGVYVAVSHRGRGVAKGMIAALIGEVKQDSSIEQLLLAVGVFNVGARKVYDSLGFRVFGLEPRALRAGAEYVDEEHMILFLRDKDAV
jgi:ribosomal protein S18 acetylase RimI-like enzyme